MIQRQTVSDKNTERTQTAEVDTGYNHALISDMETGEVQYGNVRSSLNKYGTNNTVTERQSQESQSVQKTRSPALSPALSNNDEKNPVVAIEENEAHFQIDNFEMLN